ncbi:ecdysone receptor-like isoform X5 [Eriocheir sinensis]|uniref:ecdysone receptor-like isoform X5 n=1 Tax=Eriocheir sinensis TaxID=95602 RepID=UPI0021C8E89F|nr:ecdysone receptor-like isoform X5 [Eriocheir sinensis]
MAKVLATARVDGMFVLGSGVATLNLSTMGDESCSEVSSSSPLTSPGALSPPALVSVGVSVGMSPPTSLASSDIGEVDLDFWDLDLNSPSPPHGIAPVAPTNALLLPRAMASPSDTSSLSGRDDMSPPSSLSNYGADSYGDLKKKKGPIPRQQEELCLVCGDRASGYHYNALTCEGCKGFFRRSITKNAVYQCKYGNNCEMDMYMRRKCQECRLKKCLNVGMRPECVVPESQCQVKREQKKARDKDKKDYPSLGSPIAEDKAGPISPVSKDMSAMQRTTTKPLTREQEELINTLVYYQEEFEQPTEADIKKIRFNFDGEDTSDMRFRHITEMTILTVQLIVEFSKQLPGFATLQREDQITLLKACSSEVMMLRAARRYDSKTDCIVFGNSFPYTQASYALAGLGDSAEVLFRFCRSLCKMKVDNAEYALLAAIAIFSERPNLKELKKVEKLQEIYLEALKSYVENRRLPRSHMVFAKLLNILTELRTLGNINSEMCFSLTFKNKRLPPFLAEIWDVSGY